MTILYVDGDACPVKQEVLKVAERYKISMILVSNSGLHMPQHPLLKQVVVSDSFDAADQWIEAHSGAGDICITADIALAARCLAKQASVLGPTGKAFTQQSIGMAKAMRDLMSDLRATGDVKGYNASFTKQDRSNFLQALDRMVQTALKS